MNDTTEKRAVDWLGAGSLTFMGGKGLLDQYGAYKQQLKHPQTPRAAGVVGMGGSVASVSGIGAPKVSLTGSGLTPMSTEERSGGMNVMGSATTILDEFRERAMAFDWGAEQFCKAAGFDSEDTKIMMALIKESAGARPVRPIKPAVEPVAKPTVGAYSGALGSAASAAAAERAAQAKALAGQPMPSVPTPSATGGLAKDPEALARTKAEETAKYYARQVGQAPSSRRIGGALPPGSTAERAAVGLSAAGAPAKPVGTPPIIPPSAAAAARGEAVPSVGAPAAPVGTPKIMPPVTEQAAKGMAVPSVGAPARRVGTAKINMPAEFQAAGKRVSEELGPKATAPAAAAAAPSAVQPSVGKAGGKGRKGKVAPAGGLGEPVTAGYGTAGRMTEEPAPATAAPAPAAAAPAAAAAVAPKPAGGLGEEVVGAPGTTTPGAVAVPPAEAVKALQEESAARRAAETSAAPASVPQQMGQTVGRLSNWYKDLPAWKRTALLGAGLYGGHQMLTEGGSYPMSDWLNSDKREEHSHIAEMNRLRRKIELERKQREAGVYTGGAGGGGAGGFRDPRFTALQTTSPIMADAILRNIGNPNVSYLNQMGLFGTANDPMLGANLATTLNQHASDNYVTLTNEIANRMQSQGMDASKAPQIVGDWVRNVNEYRRRTSM